MVMKDILVKLPKKDNSYRILLEPGLRAHLTSYLAELSLPAHLAVVTDTLVGRLYGQELLQTLSALGVKPLLLTVARGERSKSWATVARLARKMLAQGLGRQTLLLALGGGVVGDLTGFLASIFMRGVPFIQIPTTLLAMVDAAIGGKTAIDLPQGKNLLGTFHQPRVVLIDPEFLLTLPPEQRRNGLAELLKTALIRDAGLVELLASSGPALFQDKNLSDRPLLVELIFRAAAIKAAVVSADEKEGDLRRILNFGHTLGHALEQCSGYKLQHGEAVALGMAAALELSVQLSGLSRPEAQRGLALLRAFDLPLTPPRFSPEDIVNALKMDKKRQDDNLVFVLLKKLGEAVIQPQVPVSLITDWLNQEAEGGR
jgi:3-dehydroquinate synthase